MSRGLPRRPLAPALAVTVVLVAAGAPAAAAGADVRSPLVAQPTDVMPRMSGCTPVRVRGRAVARCRLARVERGRVPCVHVETARRTVCRFTRRSGRWLESTSGRLYAMAGQAITRTGRRGGRHVVASRVRRGRVPCVEPRRRARSSDSAGTPSGQELAVACMVEVLNSSANASGLALRNFATREVCTSSFPHPDGATLVRQPAPDIYCYSGQGAGLNDINGTERKEDGVYYSESEFCHVAWISGVEAPVAKRPATRSYPSPGSVIQNSALLWRPVNPNVTIANG